MGNRTNGDSLKFKAIRFDEENGNLIGEKLGRGFLEVESLRDGTAKYIAVPVKEGKTSVKSRGE